VDAFSLGSRHWECVVSGTRGAMALASLCGVFREL